jgi:DHA1 family vesicular acetylcholine transporter-like MFS transporter 3
MREQMHATEWQMGLIWLPGFLPHITGVYLTVKLNQRYPKYQWLLAAIGLILQGTMCLFIPFCRSYALLMIPISGICFGLFIIERFFCKKKIFEYLGNALVDTALLPTLAYLVDVRHTSVYGFVENLEDFVLEKMVF